MRIAARLALLAVLLVAALAASLSLGAAGMPLREVLDTLAGAGDEVARTIVLDLRLPRAALAALVGGALGLAGAVFQALLRNPLAEPYILGISGGAAVGAVCALLFGGALGAGALATTGVVPIAALGGALLAIALVFRVAAGAGGLDTRILLLAGVVVGAFFNALILLMLTFAEVDRFRAAIFWMMGSLAGARWSAVGWLAVYLLPCVLVLVSLARPFNLLAIGEDTALHLGTRVERVKKLGYFVASLMVAATVAVSGIVGFIGLIVPHALRLAWGSDHRLLLPASFIAGATFLVAADTLARTVTAPSELPVGVVTALIGVPLFVVLLRRRTA